MHLPTTNVRDIPDLEPTLLAPHSHGQASGQDFDPLVSARMDVTRNPAARIEPHFQLEQLADVSRPVCQTVRWPVSAS
jgi:hypothetical protein